MHDFIRKWRDREGGAERANAAMYLVELTAALGVPAPDPAGADTAHNDYVFERAVRTGLEEGPPRRIDLYKKGCFLLEAKQSRWTGGAKGQPFDAAEVQADMLAGDGRALRGWDALMRNARAQARAYVADLPVDHPAPPFLVICDMARGFEIWADFSGTGRGYAPFPDRQSFRIAHGDLDRPEVKDRLRAIWTEPARLDPTRIAAVITRAIVDELAVISRELERQGYPAEDVAHFLMRCIFTIFAADVGLLPKPKLLALLQDCCRAPTTFAPMINDLWQRLNDPVWERRFFSGFGQHVPHINGGLFADAQAFPLGAPELKRLLIAAGRDWRQVEPAIFGSLLEHALDPVDRRRLGAHYTPRAYVERVVELTVMEPLRNDWRDVLTRAEQARDDGDLRGAVRIVRVFHAELCATRVLDPACGTGNFLYVALDLMKRLEGELLDTLADLGEPEALGLETVDPHQFLGLEVNPRAAAIADLVLWIGFLQQHYRNNTGHPAEPILHAHGNIRVRDAVLERDGPSGPLFERRDGEVVPLWPNPRRPAWPAAEFIVGNPPFIGGKDLRSRMEPGYAEAVWAAHPWMNESADFVMYWWDHAADILTRPGAVLRRFGFVTTNSITQVFQRRTTERWLSGERPLGLVYAVADHPWTRASRDSAAVRIAMTVAEAGRRDGVLFRVALEAGLDTDEPMIDLTGTPGRIHADLTVGTDVNTARPLKASAGVCSPGVKLHGAGFIVSPAQAALLGLGRRPGLERHIRPYRNGRDLTGVPRGALVMDFYGLSKDELRVDFPEAYQHLAETVRRDREAQVAKSGTADARDYLDRWWVFGKPRPDLRAALDGLPRYIATVETAKHRVFQFLDTEILPDNMLVCIADNDAATLAILSSRWHAAWALKLGGWLGYGNDPRYTKSRCFDPFPFPPANDVIRTDLRAAGERLDRHRRTVLADHPDLTLTGLYNVLEAIRSGAPLDARADDVKRRGLVVILRDLHDDIDRLTAQAYGWPEAAATPAAATEVVARLTALNLERAREEAAGHIRWLRPDFQPARAGVAAQPATGDLGLVQSLRPIAPARRRFPTDRYEQPLAIQAALAAADAPLGPPELARRFHGGGRRLEPRIGQVLITLHRYGHVQRVPDGRWVAAGPMGALSSSPSRLAHAAT